MFSGLSGLVRDFGTKTLEAAYFEEVEKSTEARNYPRNILDLTSDEKRAFLKSFDLVLCDCDHVIWDLTRPIEGAGEAINLLKQNGKKFGYVSNNSVRRDEDYLKCFRETGVDVELEDIMHPIKNILAYLRNIHFEGLIYCIATQSFEDELKKFGYDVISGPNKILEESYSDLARYIFVKEHVRAVIIDVDFNLSSVKLIRAQQYLNNEDCILIIGATDTLLPVKKDVSIIGPGPYGKILSEVTKKEPIILGKPGKGLCDLIIKKYKIKHNERVLLVGDMLEQDTALGKQGDFQTLVVLTGGCKKENFEDVDPDTLPDYYAESLGDFVQFFESIQHNI